MDFGRFKIRVYNHGFFLLDGGAMFGAVPKMIWSRRMPTDGENRIRLATRSLLIEADGRRFMVDVGNGDKWPDRLGRVYAFENFSHRETGFDPASVTDIILTHLHFDHAGGISRYRPGSATDLELCYPQARVYVQADNYENALNPNARERASYLRENVEILEQANLVLTHGSEEIYPGIWVHQREGHTRGQQWVEVRDGSRSVAYPDDLIPTSHHLQLPYSMGYDMSAGVLLKEKEEFLKRAVAGDWIVVFEHDPDIPAARLTVGEKGRFEIREVVEV